MKISILVMLLAAFTTFPALSDWRCDCSQKQGACEAKIKKSSKQILISSDVPQCSQVIWYADGQPHSTTVLDGISAEEWLGPSQNPKLQIDSCTVCADTTLGNTKAEQKIPDISGNWSFRFSLPDCTTCKSNGKASFSVNGENVSGEMHISSLFFGSTDIVEGRVLSSNTIELTQIRNGNRFEPHECTINDSATQIVCHYTESTGQAGVLVYER